MEVAQGVYSLGQKDGGHVHAYLFEHGGELTLVDTLWDKDAHRVLDYIRRIGRSPSDLKHIALTHAHRSHLGGIAELKRLTGATVYSHAWEADIIAGERLAQPVSLVPRGGLTLVKFRLGLALGRPKHPPCPVDEVVGEDDSIGPLRVVFIPGHTPGHLAFHSPEKGVLAVGDAIATWPKLGAGWPGFNLNQGQYEDSLRRLAKIEADVIGVGHGDPITERGADVVHEVVDQAV
jgi:glyoxylase-like metal-dependent hydrolase (beta-lactamase superfamily II)